MLNTLFGKKKKEDGDAILAAINSLHQQMDLRFKEVSAQIKEVELGLAQLETKLLTKDLKDKQAYGLLHYKLHEAKHVKLEEEISDLELNLKRKTKGL